jgi:hypothetical protein
MDSVRTRTDVVDDSQINYDCLLDSLSPESYQSEVEFIGLEPLAIKTTNAQELYNHYQMYPSILVFDLRDSSRYQDCHLKCSVNMPINTFTSDNFINFNPNHIQKEVLDLEVDKAAFKNRKRSMCFIGKYSIISKRSPT